MRIVIPVTLTVLLLVAATGCRESNDDRLVEMAQEHVARQAEQNRQMSESHKELAEGSRQLVEADAKAREELVVLQHDLRADQAEIGHQRDQLEAERRQIAEQAYAVERARAEARKKGHVCMEQTLSDGSIKLTIQVGGGAA